jgi:hypothetical protein
MPRGCGLLGRRTISYGPNDQVGRVVALAAAGNNRQQVASEPQIPNRLNEEALQRARFARRDSQTADRRPQALISGHDVAVAVVFFSLPQTHSPPPLPLPLAGLKQ